MDIHIVANILIYLIQRISLLGFLLLLLRLHYGELRALGHGVHVLRVLWCPGSLELIKT